MSNKKSVEEMIHDYVVAMLKSGKSIEESDIAVCCQLVYIVKEGAKKLERDMIEDARRRW